MGIAYPEEPVDTNSPGRVKRVCISAFFEHERADGVVPGFYRFMACLKAKQAFLRAGLSRLETRRFLHSS